MVVDVGHAPIDQMTLFLNFAIIKYNFSYLAQPIVTDCSKFLTKEAKFASQGMLAWLDLKSSRLWHTPAYFHNLYIARKSLKLNRVACI